MSEPTPEFWSPAQAAEDLGSIGSGGMFASVPPPTAAQRPSRDALPLLLTLGLALLTCLMTRGTDANLGLNAPLLVLVLFSSLGLASRLRRSQVKTPALVLLALGTLCAVGLT